VSQEARRTADRAGGGLDGRAALHGNSGNDDFFGGAVDGDIRCLNVCVPATLGGEGATMGIAERRGGRTERHGRA